MLVEVWAQEYQVVLAAAVVRNWAWPMSQKAMDMEVKPTEPSIAKAMLVRQTKEH